MLKSQAHWLTRNIDNLLHYETNAWGDALAAPACLLFDEPDPDRQLLLGRYIAYTLTKPDGSLERTSEYRKEWATVTRSYPTLQVDTVRRALAKWSDAEYQAFLTEACKATFRHAWGRHEHRERFVAQIDENQIRFQGRGSKLYRKSGDFRGHALSEAGRNATSAKEGRWFGTAFGHEYIVLSATMYPAGKTLAVAYERRPALRYNRAATFKRLLDHLRQTELWPQRVLFDKGLQAYKVLEHAAMFARDSQGHSDFITPCQRPTRIALRETPSGPFALEGMREIANKGLPLARPVPGLREHYYFQERRKIKFAPHVDCNLVIVYHPKESAWDNKDRDSWVLEREWEWFGFYCYNDQSDETIRDAYEGYSERWNCENFYQRLGYFMTILPSKNLPHRTMSFGYALMAANVYALRGIMRNESPATDEEEWLSIKTFFDVASRQLQVGLDPPEWQTLIPTESR